MNSINIIISSIAKYVNMPSTLITKKHNKYHKHFDKCYCNIKNRHDNINTLKVKADKMSEISRKMETRSEW